MKRGERSSKSLALLAPSFYELPTVPAHSAQVKLFQETVGDLQGSSAGTIIGIRLLASDVKFSSPEDLAKVLDRVDARRKDLSDFEKELLDLAVGSALLDLRKVKEAERVIKRIRVPSVELDGMKRTLAELKTFIK